MGEKIALLVLAVLFLAGCTSGILGITAKPPESIAPTEAELATIQDIKDLLVATGAETSTEVRTLLEAKLAELDAKLQQSEVYVAGKQTVAGIWQLLAAFGVVGGTGATLLQRKKRKDAEAVTVETENEAGALAYGLRLIEDAILKTGKDGKVVTGNIKAEGTSAVNAVNQARALANGA